MAADLIDALRRYKNVIAEGVPGTGKTFAIESVVDRWQQQTGRELGGHSVMTMHPSTGYEEFVEGIRPGQGTAAASRPRFDQLATPSGPTDFRLLPGFFLDECARAMAEPDKDHLVVLDELNRANVPRVLGDLLLLLEPSKRASHDGSDWHGMETVLPYSGSRLLVPNNLYVLGTMNTTDRSVTLLDAALRRRFAFVRLEPMDAAELKAQSEDLPDGERALFKAHVDAWSRLNHGVLRPALGADGMLGHSYLFGLLEELRAGVDPVIEQLKAVVDNSDHTAWIQLGKMTGGSGNQFNLPKSGTADPARGPVHVFVPSGTPQDEEFDLDFDGDVFEGCRLHMPNSGSASGTWQVFLEGKTAQGKSFQQEHKHAFSDAVGVFGWDDQQAGLLHAAVLPPSMIPKLQQVSSHADTTPQGKAFGILGTLGDTDAVDVAGAAMWRYELLPQLFENLLGQSAEDLLDAAQEQDWLDRHPALAPQAVAIRSVLADFRTFLAERGVTVAVAGVGLGRTPVVEPVDPELTLAQAGP